MLDTLECNIQIVARDGGTGAQAGKNIARAGARAEKNVARAEGECNILLGECTDECNILSGECTSAPVECNHLYAARQKGVQHCLCCELRRFLNDKSDKFQIDGSFSKK